MPKPAKKISGLDWVVWLCLVGMLGIGIYASCIEPFTLVVTQNQIATKKWPYTKPIKIAVLADIHFAYPWMTAHHFNEIVQRTNQEKPDVVFLLGDYHGHIVPSIEIPPDEAFAPLKKLYAKCGVYAVLGNHDLRPAGEWPAALIRTKIPVLQNQAVPVTCDGQDFWVAGLEDLWWQHSDINAALHTVKNKKPVFMLMHNPDSFPNMPKSVAVTFAGHTHGGQLKFPFIGAIKEVVPSSYGLRYLYGHIVEDEKDMFVTSGLGMTGIPLRLMTPPEIAIITIQNSASP